MAPHGATNGHLRWPPDRFYWAVLDGAVLSAAPGTRLVTRRQRVNRLGYLLEGYLPGLPIEEIHAVYERVPGSRTRYVACGVPQRVLETEIGADAVTLAPTALPSFVPDEIDPARLNLLTGPFEPRPVRAVKRRGVALAALAIVLCAGFLTVGLERRTAAAREVARQTAAREMAAYVQVLGPAARASVGTAFPPERRLTAELRRLEETRSEVAPVVDAVDCGETLAALLAGWPQDVSVRTQSVSVSPDTITIRGKVPAMSDAQHLADALQSLRGWSVVQPQTQATRDGVNVTVRVRRDPEPGAAAAPPAPRPDDGDGGSP